MKKTITTTVTTITTEDTPSDNRLSAYILLDRSGSMSSRWDEALSSINAYVSELKDDNAKITLATFDHMAGLQFDILRDSVASKDWKLVTSAEASPRGGTPLYDAMMRIIAMAEKSNNNKTVIVVMTDGESNGIQEASKNDANAARDRCEKRGWAVVFLGADFNAFEEAGKVGVGVNRSLNMSEGFYVTSMKNLANNSRAYYAVDAVGCSSSMDFSEQDRFTAAGKV